MEGGYGRRLGILRSRRLTPSHRLSCSRLAAVYRGTLALRYYDDTMDLATEGGSVSLPAYSIDAGHAPRVERATWLGAGAFCTCYLVNGAYVFRFADHAAASAAMRVERCLLPLLGDRLAVAVPRVEFAGRRADSGQTLMGYKLLPGAPLERAALEGLPPARRAALISQLAAFARHLHALPPPVAGRCAIPTLHPPTHLAAVMCRARAALRPHLAAPVWQHHEDLFARYAREPTLQAYRPAVLHGDLSPDHILADAGRGGLAGIIDWGDARIGDPAWDLVYIREDYGPDTLRAFLERYDPGGAPLIARKVRIYQHLNNVAYGLWMLTAGDEEGTREALAILDEQAVAAGERG